MLGDLKTQIRGGTGVFTGRPAYVWISNQIGNTGVLTGFDEQGRVAGTTSRPFNPNPDHYKPTNVTGAPAATYELALTDLGFKFPQIWRSNIAWDQRLPGGWTSTVEFLYNKDVNGIYYINANLPAAQTAFVGADNRPRWTNNRINANVSNAVVLKNESVGSSWNFATTMSKSMRSGFSMRGAPTATTDPGTPSMQAPSRSVRGPEIRTQATRTTLASLTRRRLAARLAIACMCRRPIPMSTSDGGEPPSRCSGRVARAARTRATSSPAT